MANKFSEHPDNLSSFFVDFGEVFAHDGVLFFVSKEGAARIKNRKKISGGGGQKIRAIGQGDFVM